MVDDTNPGSVATIDDVFHRSAGQKTTASGNVWGRVPFGNGVVCETVWGRVPSGNANAHRNFLGELARLYLRRRLEYA